MSRPIQAPPAVTVVHFTRRIARQCRMAGLRAPDWVVCDTVANGERRVAARRGQRGGRLVLFERTYPAQGGRAGSPAPFRGKVAVLGELTRRGCFALRLIRPSLGGKKTGMVWDF